MISKRLSKERKKYDKKKGKEVEASFFMQAQLGCWEIIQALLQLMSFRKCHIKRTTAGAAPNIWDIVCRDVEY